MPKLTNYKEFNNRLGKGTRSKRLVENKQSEALRVKGMDSLLQIAKHAATTFERQPSRMGQSCQHVIDVLQQNAKAVDVFIQQDPFVSSLVWGSIRVILEASYDSAYGLCQYSSACNY
jgi:hypothetical protein